MNYFVATGFWAGLVSATLIGAGGVAFPFARATARSSEHWVASAGVASPSAMSSVTVTLAAASWRAGP